MSRSRLLPLFVFMFGVFAACAHADAPSPNRTVQANEAAVRKVYEKWATAFRTHDIAAIMSLYGPEEAVVAYDFAPPLQYRGKAVYRKSYEELTAQYDGPIEIEFRDLRVVAGEDVAFIHALERIVGKLKNGGKSDIWGRCTSGLRKSTGAG